MNILNGLKLLAELFSEPVKGYVERKKIKTTAKVEVMKAQARAAIEAAENGQRAEIDWDLRALDNSGWKDEYLTIVLSIPAVLCFIPMGQPLVVNGFVALEQTPDWYIYVFGSVVAAGVGIRRISDFFAKRGAK